MIKKIIPIALSFMVIFTGCANDTNDNKESIKLTYSNLLDDETQTEIKKVLIDKGIKKSTSEYFIKLINNYNEISDMKNLYTSNKGFTSINVQQVPYDEAHLAEKWDYNNINYIDFNCRLTSFILFKDYIKSDSLFKGDDINLIFDIDVIENNPMSKLTNEDKNKFINLNAQIDTTNTEDTKIHIKNIQNEWKNRKISFIDNSSISMINVFLHSPEDKILFIGHSGILVEVKDGFLFIEKYGISLPYQVSKFKDKSQLKEYLMDRLDVNAPGYKAAKPIIMENDKVMN